MQNRRSEQLKDIMSLSEQMLEKARALEWESVAALEARRRDMVMQCFSSPSSEQEAPLVAAAIRRILELNDQITRLGRDSRDQLGAELHTRKTARTASAAYLGCAG